MEQLGLVGVPGPAAAALGEEHDRQPPALGELEQAVGLAVVAQALRAGQHRVVVGQHRARHPADRRGPAHHPVRRGAGDEVVLVAAQPLGGQGQAAVLAEAPRVAEVRDVLAGRAPPRLVAAAHRLRAGLVEDRRAALEHPGEVGAGAGLARRPGGAAGSGVVVLRGGRGRLHAEQRLALAHLLARGHREAGHDAGLGRRDLVVHLHRLDEQDGGAGGDGGARGREHLLDDPGEGGQDHGRTPQQTGARAAATRQAGRARRR